MISKTTKITNETGFHMRPANVFVTAMTKYASDIELVVDNKRINGKSIMNIMAPIPLSIISSRSLLTEA